MASSATGPEAKLEIRRMFAAPREKVFEAWTQREKLEKWMCRFPHNETRYTAVDVRPGGTNSRSREWSTTRGVRTRRWAIGRRRRRRSRRKWWLSGRLRLPASHHLHHCPMRL